jgi:hypothetical protein
MVEDRIMLVSGIAMPFYPMRPTRGKLGTPEQLHEDLGGGWVIQPKLNGDRATLGVFVPGIFIQNRHLSRFKHRVKNADLFKALPNGTCVDGEVYGSEFFPFEVLALGRDQLLDSPVEFRVSQAERLCSILGVPWIFQPPSQASLAFMREQPKKWEGYVKKRSGSAYAIYGVERDSDEWFKCKWD